MSLFPAYTPGVQRAGDVECAAARGSDDEARQSDRIRHSQSLSLEATALSDEGEAAREAALLASSDSDSEPPPPPAPAPAPIARDYYLDVRPDSANVGVHTLYYPGRPIYERHGARAGTSGGGPGEERGSARHRYYLRPPEPALPAPRELGARARAMRDLLNSSPRDPDLWLRYLRFQEEWAEARSWVAASEEAARAVPGRGGARLRVQRLRARRAALPRADLLAALAQDIAQEDGSEVRLECWLRLVWVLSSGCGEEEAARAASAALTQLPHSARAYPLLLHAYGAMLRAAGLWERLVLLLELVCATNYPPSRAFPPPAPPAREERLRAAEDALVDGGLPLSAVWVRVERLRAAAHWRPEPAAAPAAEADPQRAPPAADLAPLVRAVRPAASLLACVAMLRLAGVPPLPASETARRACTAGCAEGADGDGGAGPALLALGRAARRLPAGHAARVGPEHAGALRRSLGTLLDPPHRFSDEAGFLSWTRALWAAALEWAACARRRLALVCWRLRDLHALVRLAERGGAEARRLRVEARALLKAHGGSSPATFALFARIEAECGEGASARRCAAQALRASAGVRGVSRETALFCARVLRELEGEGPAAQWALCCAALGRAPPSDATCAPPPPDLLREALHECASRCTELERGWEEGEGRDVEAGPDAEVWLALGAGGAGEWGAARVTLLDPGARRDELQRLLLLGHERVHQSAGALQYYEATGAALVTAATREARLTQTACALLPLFPDNALLALASGGAALWARRGAGEGAAGGAETARWARVLPALLRAPVDDAAAPADMERVARVAARAAGGGADGGAGLAALRLEAEARAARPAAERVLLAALADHPAHKWVAVRGAAWVPAQAEALCDAALERGLRTHALLHELRPLPARGGAAGRPAEDGS